jgi:tRNA A37 N6-isopentenylltransferase MiaA
MTNLKAITQSTTLTFVIGATGCGKTAVAVSLARAQRQEDDASNTPRLFICVINCDVLQFYEGLPIATNKASLEELTFADGTPIPHYFMSFLSPMGSRRAGVTSSSTYASIVGHHQDGHQLAQEEDVDGGQRSDAGEAQPQLYHIHDYVREVESFLYGTVFPQHAACDGSDGVTDMHRGCSVIVCGGSHYYAQSLLFEGGLVTSCEATHSEVPSDGITNADPATREGAPERASSAALWNALHSLDPTAASQVHPQNTRRIERMLELARQGRKPSAVYTAQRGGDATVSHEKHLLKFFAPRLLATSPSFEDSTTAKRIQPLLSVVWVDGSRDWLQSRLDARVDDMLARGMINEVHELAQWVAHEREHTKRSKRPRDDCQVDERCSTLLGAIGFKEWAPLLAESDAKGVPEQSSKRWEACAASVKQSTRRYAKQQVQWVRNRFLGVYRSHWEQQLIVADTCTGDAEPTTTSVTVGVVPFLRVVMDKCLSIKPPSVPTQAYLDQCVRAEILPRIASPQLQQRDACSAPWPCYLEDALGGGNDGERRVVADGHVDRKTLHTCTLCSDLVVSGEEQWASHLASKRHRGALRHQALVEQQRALGREIPPRSAKRQ